VELAIQGLFNLGIKINIDMLHNLLLKIQLITEEPSMARNYG